MGHVIPAEPESVFTYGAPGLKFGVGARHEIGFDLAARGARRVLIVSDPHLAELGLPDDVARSVRASGLTAVVYAQSRVEPTDASIEDAIAFARAGGPWDAIVAVGGGSSIDTAKAVNLLVTNPGELLDYVNAPVGLGRPPSEPLLPLVAVPTTTGTGSESTTICVLDVVAQRVKSGISHPALRPTLAVVDPELTLTQPPEVTAASGLDVMSHALESYTARAYTTYERKAAHERVPYCGANPIADLWCERSLQLLAGSFRQAVRAGDDLQARTQMALAATFAGLGFGNAGVHLPHANAYPIAGQVGPFAPDGYPADPHADHGLVPHGMAVALTAPASFRFTFEASPDRHVRAARLLGPEVDLSDGPDLLPAVVTQIMRDVELPPGLAALGFKLDDVEELADGTMKQQRLLATAPKPVAPSDVEGILRDSFELW